MGPAKSLNPFTLHAGLASALETLVELVAKGRLTAEISWRGPWEKVGEAAEALFGRRVNGKAVLDVEPYGGRQREAAVPPKGPLVPVDP